MKVNRSILLDALRRNVMEERAIEIMKILDPLFWRCTHNHYFFGHIDHLPEDLIKHIATIINRPCASIIPIRVHTIPHRMTTALQNSNFVPKAKTHVGLKIDALVDRVRASNMEIDLRYGFGSRLFGILPTNLWVHLWEPIRLWLLSEIVGEKLCKEAIALEHIVRLSANGLIVFDFKPSDPTVVRVVCK